MVAISRLSAAALAVSLLSVCASAPPPKLVPQPAKPALLLVLTVDQMRFDYFERFRPQLTGGLARLLNGAVFTDAHHDHAITETAPGHATLMSGRFPRSTGITRNLAGVNTPDAPLIGASDLGASPFRFRGTTVTDWLTAADPATRALSVSSKDRAAILPIGRSKQEIYWYANNGTFTTSTYYRDTLPDWVKAFNALRLPHRWAGQAWDLILPESAYVEADSFPVEGFGRNYLFPHRLPLDSAVAANNVRYTPAIDDFTLRFALTGVRTLELGNRGSTDVLAVSLSGTDYVGHFFGPESRELHDQIIRLDRVLGAFFDTLYTLRDSTRIIVAMSADHGVGLTPERDGKLRVGMEPALAPLRAKVVAAGGDSLAIDFESGALFVDSTRLGGMSVGKVTKEFLNLAKKIPGVERVDRFADLNRKNLEKDEIARRWLQMFPDDMLPVAVVTLSPGNILDYPIVATHGSPHRYDSHVPIVFMGSPFAPGRYDGFVRTVDIAPTLAAVLGLTPAEPLDGRVLEQAIRRP